MKNSIYSRKKRIDSKINRFLDAKRDFRYENMFLGVKIDFFVQITFVQC